MKKGKVLVVDDIKMNRILLEDILKDDYDIIEAEDGLAAINILLTTDELPLIVLLDIMMPEMNGYEVLELIKSNPRICHIPVFFISATDQTTNEEKGLLAGAVDYITKPFSPNIVRARINNHIELKKYRDSLEKMVDEKVMELTKAKEDILVTMADIIEYRNQESGQHAKRTSKLTSMLITELINNSKYSYELIQNEFEIMIKAIPLHDIGKIAIPDNILLKPGHLTPDEFDTIKTHTTIGSDIIKSLLANDDTKYFQHCYNIARHHHEWYNGEGYPDGLSGSEIPLPARILAVVDVYDALVSKRVYKPAFTHDKAVDIIRSSSDTQFDPIIVNAMLNIHNQFNDTYNE